MTDKVTFNFKMNEVVEDSITGFKGVVIGQLIYLNGCKRILVQPQMIKDGGMVDAQWIDEQQLSTIKESASSQKKASVGGPSRYDP